MSALVDTVEACRKAVDELLLDQEVAVDIEGESLSRDGSIALIQITNGADDSCVYLFDIHVLRSTAFEEGGLRQLFEDPRIVKIFFDVRADLDALYHIYGIHVRSVYDLQVLYHIKFIDPSNKFLKGLHNALMDFAKTEGSTLCAEALMRVKDEGKKLFAPELGGSYSAWTARPLSPVLMEYAVADAKHLQHMKRLWGGTPDAAAKEGKKSASLKSKAEAQGVCCPPSAPSNGRGNDDGGGDDDDGVKEEDERSSPSPSKHGIGSPSSSSAEKMTLDLHVKSISDERAAVFVGLPRTMTQEEKKMRDFDIPRGFNDTGHVTKHLHVPKNRLGIVIGKKGATINAIQKSSGAFSVHMDGENIFVTGLPDQVDAAMLQIEAKIHAPSQY